MKMESLIHLKLVVAVTKYFGKMLSRRQMIESQKWMSHFFDNNCASSGIDGGIGCNFILFRHNVSSIMRIT